MNTFTKAFLLALMIMYVLSPVDFVPGPIDDLILLVWGFPRLMDSNDYSSDDWD